MTYPAQQGPGRCPAYPPTPTGPLKIFGPAFSANPHAVYEQLRTQAPVAPVEFDHHQWGYLAVTFRAAMYLLRNNPKLFSKDPHHWEALRRGEVPPTSPALMMMGPRDNALWKDGDEHLRLRRALTSALGTVDTHQLARTVTEIADHLIDRFASIGTADLVAQYCDVLPTLTVNAMYQAPPEISKEIIDTVTRLFLAGPDAAEANAALELACLELTRYKRSHPGRDVVSSLIATGLNDAEMVPTLILLFGAAGPPPAKLIASGLLRILTDDRFAGDVHTGVHPVANALDDVLWQDPPVPNYCPLYARGVQIVEGVHIQPGIPILISFAAANTDPALTLGLPPGARTGNRGHLAFSAGAHACAAPGLARVICETAVERALDRLPGLALTIPPDHVPPMPGGTFIAGPAALPVRFQRDAPHPARSGRTAA
ncbi:cytochrome P450 [Streptomyces sp. SAI-208]|uniref:cytochrome P450 n=1 Tax=Streptomyces sp. SAI-208 TaxID=2940550 RepID=UPI002475D45F|nr:cytochrome P450 [Streptomyces sp. SAI-208]MDH6604528.1 cytochrome P450 [Streptomyces sp. SAI-208]